MYKVLDARQILFRLQKRRFQDVKELVLTGGELQEITDLAYFNFLEYLDLSHNYLVQAHYAACLQFAVLIDLSYNSLHSFIAIPGLPRLEILRLGHNSLICVNVSSCQRLRVLNLENNQLTDLKGVCECCSLEYLNCANNQIAELAHFEALYRCQHLRSLCAAGNPASCGTAYRWRLESALEQLEVLDDQPLQHRRFDATRTGSAAMDLPYIGPGRQSIEQAVAMQLDEKDNAGLSRKIERLEDRLFQLTGLMMRYMYQRPFVAYEQLEQSDSAYYHPAYFSQYAGARTAARLATYLSKSQNAPLDDAPFFEALCGYIAITLGFDATTRLRAQLEEKLALRFEGSRRYAQMFSDFIGALSRETYIERQLLENEENAEKQAKIYRNSDYQGSFDASRPADVAAGPLFSEQSSRSKGYDADNLSLFKAGSASSQEPPADEVPQRALQQPTGAPVTEASYEQVYGASNSNPSPETRNDNSSVVRLQKYQMRDKKDSSQMSSLGKDTAQQSNGQNYEFSLAKGNQQSSRFFEHEETATISSYSAGLSGHEDCHLPRAATMIKPPSAEPQISDIELGSRPISQLSNRVDEIAAENAKTVDVAAKFKAEQIEEKHQQSEKSESIPSRISIAESQSERLDQAARAVKPIVDDDDDLDDFDGVDLEPDW